MLEQPTTSFDPFAGPEIAHVLHVTDSQEELWHSCLFGGEDANRAYNESLSLILKGNLDRTALDKGVRMLIQRHEALRSVFSPDGRYMCVLTDLKIEIDHHDISDASESEKKTQTEEYLDQDAQRSFDLINGPLIRVGLIKLDNETHRLVITTHHIICDGWSYGIILQELGKLYTANTQNTTANLPEPIAYSAYAEHQRLFSESKDYNKVEQFWLDQYEDQVPQVNIPTDFPRPNQRTYKGNRIDQALGTELVDQLKKAGIKANSSLVVTLMAAFEIFLYEITGQKNLALGLPAAGQSAMGAKHLIGHCVHLLPLKSSINLEGSFVDHLQKRKSANFDAYEHQELTFGRLLKKLNVGRNASRIPLVPVVLNIDMGLADDVSFEGLNYELISNPRKYETFELFLNATGSQDDIVLEWSYNATLFKECSIIKMATSFEAMLRKLIAHPNEKLQKLTTKKVLNYEIKGPELRCPNSTLHDLLQEQATKTPEALALQFGEEKISYVTLQQRINQTAHYLWSEGIRPGQVVAVSLDRSPALIVSIFAVLQCGASYVPIDTNYPDGRLGLMVTDSEASLLISSTERNGLTHTSKTIRIDTLLNAAADFPTEPLDVPVKSESAAYIIYTSGSTGKPKGVQVAHNNAINLVYSMGKEPGISASDKIFAVTTISFDAMVMEIFLPLLHGASAVLVDEDTRRDGHLLLKKAVEDQITLIWGTPTIWQILLDSGWEKPLAIKALIGGEPVPMPLAHELLELTDELWNIYGPTETTVCAFLTKITKEDNPITIGKPVANTHAYLLDEDGNAVSEGEVGEIVIGGAGVSLGYLNRPELTAESFVTDSYQEENAKMYHSGDLGKLLPNGQMQCLGRRDNQVKVRGYRIELGEIEHLMQALSGVNSAVVDVQDHVLKAYVVPSNSDADFAAQAQVWKQGLSAELPSYMVPHEFISLEELPITTSGKLDRKLLANLSSNGTIHADYNEPRTEAEKIVSDIWQESLGLEKVDIFSDFFDIGGHSMVAAKVMTQIEKKTGKRLPLASLFEHSTIEKLALLLHLDDRLMQWGSLVPIKPQGSKPPIFMVHGAGLNVLNFNSLARYVDKDQPIYGLQAKGLNGNGECLTSVEDIAAHYNKIIIDTQPEGPYAIAGYSFGGVIAYEMAYQLIAKDKKVSMLGLFDTYRFPAYQYPTKWGKRVGDIRFFAGQKVHTIKHMFGSLTGFKFRTKKYMNMFRKLVQRVASSETEPAELSTQRALEIMQVNNRAIANYHLKPADLKVTLFRAKQQDEYMHDYTYLGWKPFALNGIDIYDVSGDHYSIFTPPNDEVFAKVLQEALDENNIRKDG